MFFDWFSSRFKKKMVPYRPLVAMAMDGYKVCSHDILALKLSSGVTSFQGLNFSLHIRKMQVNFENASDFILNSQFFASHFRKM